MTYVYEFGIVQIRNAYIMCSVES